MWPRRKRMQTIWKALLGYINYCILPYSLYGVKVVTMMMCISFNGGESGEIRAVPSGRAWHHININVMKYNLQGYWPPYLHRKQEILKVSCKIIVKFNYFIQSLMIMWELIKPWIFRALVGSCQDKARELRLGCLKESAGLAGTLNPFCQMPTMASARIFLCKSFVLWDLGVEWSSHDWFSRNVSNDNIITDDYLKERFMISKYIQRHLHHPWIWRKPSFQCQ